MDELDLFRDLRRGVAAPSADAQRRASVRLASAIDEATGRKQAARPHQGRLRWRAVAIALAVLVCGLLVAPALGLGERLLDLLPGAPAEPPTGDALHDVRDPLWSPDGRRIAFRQLRRGNTFDVYVMNADGSGLRLLTRRGSDASPSWSPDGRRIALTAFARGARVGPPPPKRELYLLEVDGSGQRLLTRDADEVSPAWSPDGRKITFVGVRRVGTHDVYVTNADGTGMRRIARGVRENQGHLYLGPLPYPAWSPDGRKIAFISNRTGTSEIYVMNADGNTQRRLTHNTASEFAPDWSPNGTTIAFGSRRGDHWSYDDDVYAINVDGSGLRNLTRNSADDYGPVWSPDGRKIFFVSQRDGEDEIYAMDADGSDQRNLTRNPASDGSPALSPNGRRVAFVSTRNGMQEVFVMNADGSGLRRLTQHGP